MLVWSPVVLAGVRTSAVQVVATATLGALVAYGGLGRYIIDGFAIQDDLQIVAGALLVGVLSVLTEVAFGLVQRRVVPARSSTRHRSTTTSFPAGSTATSSPAACRWAWIRNVT